MKKLFTFLVIGITVTGCNNVTDKKYFIEIDKNERSEILGDDFKTKTEEITARNSVDAYQKAYTSFMISKGVSEGSKSAILDTDVLDFRLLDGNKKDITYTISQKSKDSIEVIVNKQTAGISGRIKKQIDNSRNSIGSKIIDSAELKKMKALIKIEKNEFNDDRYYLSKNHPKFRNSNYLGFYAGGNERKPTALHFLMQYRGDDWLFVENIAIKIDGKNYKFVPNSEETHVGSGFVAEWTDDTININNEIVQAWKTAKGIKYRLNGKQFYKDFNLTEQQIKGSQNIIKYFELTN